MAPFSHYQYLESTVVLVACTAMWLLWTVYSNPCATIEDTEDSAGMVKVRLTTEKKTDHYQIFFFQYDSLPQTANGVTFTNNSVTIATHCSPNNLHYLPGLVERWTGPISVAVISIPAEFQMTLSFIYRLAECYPEITRRVRFQLAKPIHTSSNITVPSFNRSIAISCRRIHESLQVQFNSTKNFAQTSLPFPNNFLRNLARSDAMTNYILSIDMDVLPSVGLYSQTERFLKRWGGLKNLKKTALVLPIFESEEGRDIPKAKRDLRVAIRKGAVRNYHILDCPKCHSPTNSSRWLDEVEAQARNTVSVVYTVNYRDHWIPSEVTNWEPFVITHKSSPFYDERFYQFGFDRISYTCELNMAGFQFDVLHPGFLIHQGLKFLPDITPEKIAENDTNFKIYQRLVGELKLKYPFSEGKCL